MVVVSTQQSHHLVLCHPTRCLLTFHGLVAVRIGVFDVAQAEGATTVHVASEFRYDMLAENTREEEARTHRWQSQNSQQCRIRQRQFLGERPPGSYWISARSTLPMVVNNSIKSSLLVDQGSCISVSLQAL